MRRSSLVPFSIAAAVAIGLTSAPSSAIAVSTDNPGSSADKPAVTTSDVLPSEGIPGSLSHAIDYLLGSAIAPLINDLSWDPNTKVLHVHYVGSAGQLPGLLKSYLPAGAFDLVKDSRSHTELVGKESPLIEVASSVGLKVAAVFPEADNSGLWVRVVVPDLPDGSVLPESTAVKTVQATDWRANPLGKCG